MRHLKYERLIRACYPPGLGEKKPKPSELSYLIYYLNTHRSQIPQAAEFLERKAQKYVAKNRIGNASVTITIMTQMIQDCKDDLNNFAPEAISIISIALDSGELGLLNCGSEAFQAFNEFHDGLQFAYDKQLIENYRKLIRKFIVVSTGTGPQARVQHDLGLQALASLSISAALGTSVGQEVLEEAIPSFYVSLPVDESGEVFDSFIQEFDSTEAHTIRNMSKNSHNLALWALRRSFDTSNGSLVVRITSRLLKCLEDLGNRPEAWSCRLFEAAAQWSQVQLRYKVVNTIIERMCRINIGSVDYLMAYSQLLNSLLASASVSFVGLAVTDVLRDLLKLQHRLITTKFDEKLGKEATKLVPEVRKVIGSLGQHTVYAGQVSDMMAEILCRYSSAHTVAPSTQSASISSDHRNPAVIRSDMENVCELLTTLPATERLMVNLWGSTQWLLNMEEPEVLISYTTAFQEYLQRAHRVMRSQARLESTLGRQFASALLDSNNQVTNFIAIYYCLVSLVEHLDQHAVTMSRWAYYVQEVGANVSKGETATAFTPSQNVALLSVSQALLLAIFKSARRDEAAQNCLKVIENRVQQKRWLPGIIYPASVPVDQAISVAVEHPPPDAVAGQDEAHPDVFIQIDSLNLSEEESAWLSAPEEALDDLNVPEDFNLYRKRAPSVATSSHTDLLLSSVRSNHTFDTETPTVSQLIRRASSTLSLQRSSPRTVDSGVMNGRGTGMRAKMVDILADLKLDSSSRGKLAV